MAKIAPQGKYFFPDVNGNPLAGGKLYTYEAGTSTPKDTFTDQGGLIANANPVILNANGWADVWLGSGGYKFVLKNASDVEQWTTDNIDGGSAQGYASTVISKSAGFSLSINEQNNVIVCTAALTISLLPNATAGDGFTAIIVNASTGNITLDPDGSETIDGAATLLIPAGNSLTLVSNGTNWYTFGYTRSVLSSVFSVKDGTDASKNMVFNTASISAATTRTKTWQNNSGTVYETNGIDVAVADGGTGASTALGGFNALSPLTTQGDVLYHDGTNNVRLAKGTAGQVLQINSGATAPEWALGLKPTATSSELSLTLGSNTNYAHGLGRLPYHYKVVLRCKTIDRGYAVNDELDITSSNLIQIGVATYANTTNVGVVIRNTPTIFVLRRDATVGDEASITPANWRVVVYAW